MNSSNKREIRTPLTGEEDNQTGNPIFRKTAAFAWAVPSVSITRRGRARFYIAHIHPDGMHRPTQTSKHKNTRDFYLVPSRFACKGILVGPVYRLTRRNPASTGVVVVPENPSAKPRGSVSFHDKPLFSRVILGVLEPVMVSICEFPRPYRTRHLHVQLHITLRSQADGNLTRKK